MLRKLSIYSRTWVIGRVYLALICIIVVLTPVLGAKANAETYELGELYAMIEQLQKRVEVLEARLTETGVQIEPQEGNTSNQPQTTIDDKRNWSQFGNGWEYRNPTVRSGFLPTFVVEIKRFGAPVTMAIFTVTLYNELGNIIGTGNGTIANQITTGEVRTVEFMIDGEHSQMASYRLQVDLEM